VAQMATVRKVETHETVMGTHEGLVDLQVGRATTQALDVNTPLVGVEVESLESTGLAQKLNGIDVLVSTIVTSTGVTLGVLVAHGRTKGIEDSAGGEVLRGNQDNGFTLTLDLIFLHEPARSELILGQEKPLQYSYGSRKLRRATYHDLSNLGVGRYEAILHLLHR
jgi:hypothetical protein